MSIRKLTRTKKALAGYEVILGRNTIAEDCRFISELDQYYGVTINYSCSMGTAKVIVYVDSDVVINTIEKAFEVQP